MVAPAGAHDAQSAVVSAACLVKTGEVERPSGARPSRVIPPRDGIGRCKRRTRPREPWQLDRCREPRPRRRSTCPARWGALQGERWVVEGCIPRHSGCVPGCRAAGFGVRCWGCVRLCRRSFGLGC